VQTLRGAEWAGGVPAAGGAALFSGFYCNELLMKLLARNDPHERLFDTYAETLPALGNADDVDVQAALRAFELVLLREIGLLPDLSRVTATQAAVRDDDRLSLLGEHGVAEPPFGDGGIAGAVLIRVQAALDHGSLPALRQACGDALPQLRGLLRGLLAYHLGAPTLRTRQVMLSLQNL
jgi:DNA repair protein RecO (recombination protein O)